MSIKHHPNSDLNQIPEGLRTTFKPGDEVTYNRIDRRTYGVIVAASGTESTVLWTEGPLMNELNDWTERAAREIREDIDADIIRDLLANSEIVK